MHILTGIDVLIDSTIVVSLMYFCHGALQLVIHLSQCNLPKKRGVCTVAETKFQNCVGGGGSWVHAGCMAVYYYFSAFYLTF